MPSLTLELSALLAHSLLFKHCFVLWASGATPHPATLAPKQGNAIYLK